MSRVEKRGRPVYTCLRLGVYACVRVCVNVSARVDEKEERWRGEGWQKRAREEEAVTAITV